MPDSNIISRNVPEFPKECLETKTHSWFHSRSLDVLLLPETTTTTTTTTNNNTNTTTTRTRKNMSKDSRVYFAKLGWEGVGKHSG